MDPSTVSLIQALRTLTEVLAERSRTEVPSIQQQLLNAAVDIQIAIDKHLPLIGLVPYEG